MAIRLSGSISRKIPIDGVPFSSQSFSCGMDLEISNPSEIQDQLVELYANLNRALDAQIARTAQQPASVQQVSAANVVPIHSRPAPVQSAPPPPQQRNGYAVRNRVAGVNGSANGNGNIRRITATEAQVKCVYALTKSLGLDLVSVLADFNVSDPRDLQVRDCSRLIDSLKAQQNGNGAPR